MQGCVRIPIDALCVETVVSMANTLPKKGHILDATSTKVCIAVACVLQRMEEFFS